MTPYAATAARWALTVLGTWLVSRGLLSAEQVSALSPDILHALGTAATVATLAWGLWQKTHQKKAVAAAKADGAAAVASAQLGAVANTGVKS